eukprot:CAMPEP_0117559282 /NCGR_PEP_ID=MMETSP0784-20121206/53277_1 /TAXON_ID=39447 /ORGANISM="" /LENGTH=83 /DNA_ID=CAMNT_0005356649 /DNA_START=63 /DNA_END=314 /DNA_ORIENTATION=-
MVAFGAQEELPPRSVDATAELRRPEGLKRQRWRLVARPCPEEKRHQADRNEEDETELHLELQLVHGDLERVALWPIEHPHLLS